MRFFIDGARKLRNRKNSKERITETVDPISRNLLRRNKHLVKTYSLIIKFSLNAQRGWMGFYVQNLFLK